MVLASHLKDVHLSVKAYCPFLLSLANLVSSKPKNPSPSQIIKKTSNKKVFQLFRWGSKKAFKLYPGFLFSKPDGPFSSTLS